MRILLIGATGAIGRRVMPLLLQAGHAVTAVGRSEAARNAVAAAGATPIALDIFDRRAAAKAAAGHEVLIDLATKIPTGPIRPFLPAAWKPNDRVRREGSAVLRAQWYLRGASRVPTTVRLYGRPLVNNGGTLTVGDRVRLSATVATTRRFTSA